MSYRPKRKLEDFDPNKSDPEDLDYGDASPPRHRVPGRRNRPKGTPRKPLKRRRETYGDSEDDVDLDSEGSEEEESFADSSEEEEQVELNPRTGRGVRSVAKKPVKYEEDSDEEESLPSDSDRDPLHPTPARSKRTGNSVLSNSSLIVKLKIPVRMQGDTAVRARRGSKTVTKREPTPKLPGSGGRRRSSRLSHDDIEPLVALTDSGRHEVVTRAGTATPEPIGSRRPTRGSKGLKKPPSAIMEASQEGSVAGRQPVQDQELLSQLAEAAAADETEEVAVVSHGEETEKDDDIHMEYDDAEDHVVQESQPDPEEAEEDEGPVNRSGRNLRARRKTSTPPASQPSASRRSLRNRKSAAEPSSDFEPEADADAEGEEDLSESDDLLKPPRGRSSNEGSASGRRSGRLAVKAASQRSRSGRHASDDEVDDLDPEEIADEAAELDEDNRRNRRSRKRPAHKSEIAFEPNLRNRASRPDYRIFRPELAFPVEDDDGPAATAITPQRNRRAGGGHTSRSLFSTFGPFGGAGGPPPVFGGPDGTTAIGGVDSDSSDDEGVSRAIQSVGGSVGMTPTSAFPKPYTVPQALNNDPVQGPGGGPPGLGKVKDKKMLADADPLGVDVNVTFDGVGGLDNHINQLKEMVTLPLLYPEVFQRFHVTPPRGVLFHGPPGTGKTLLARALASSVSSQGRKVTFYMRKGADALSKWVGEAEKQLRLLFEEARKNQPSIIFFDEIDGLAPVRSSKQEQIHASIVATLLALMDGMDGRGQVIVIGATNRPDSVDPALRRPGRFDREFYFPLPDEIGRRKIIDIHTKGWDPPLKPDFRNELAKLTRGYGGADLRALCTEAALNAVQGTYPQIYSSNQKLIIDPSTIKILAKDFMISVNKIVPSSERSAASGAAPLKRDVEPLLRKPLQQIEDIINEAIPRKRKATALEEAMYDDRDDELGFEKETMQREFESSRIFRPRLLIHGMQGMGQQYLGAAMLHKFEGLHVQNFDLATLLKDSTRSPEAAVVQLFEEVKRHKPSVIYIPDINTWYRSLSDTVIRTFVGLLRSLPPTDPVLLLGISEIAITEDLNPDMVRELFGFSTKNIYHLARPDEKARLEFFEAIVEKIRKAPSEFPDVGARKRRKLAVLPVAPSEPVPQGPSKAETKAQKKKDRTALNTLKLFIQTVMDQIKLKYKKFRNPIVEDSMIGYLYDEQNPEVLTTNLDEAQRQQAQLFRPYELDKDDKGVPGLREVASGKFYYNLEIVTIEKRLSNGYYKRPKDFLADIKRLAKDAKTSGDQDRTLKANEMLANVEVDMATLEQNQAAFCLECEAVYERELERERQRVQKEREAQRRGEDVPKIVPNVPPPQASKTTTESSGPVRLGQEVPGAPPLFQLTPSRLPGPSPISNPWSATNGSGPIHGTNGSTVPSRPHEDSDMPDSQDDSHGGAPPTGFTQSQGLGPSQWSQKTAHTHVAQGSQLDQYQNSASTTTSGQKTSDRSNRSSGFGTHYSNGTRHGDHPDFSMMQPVGGSQLPDTQPLSGASQSSPQMMGPPRSSNRLSVQLILNDPADEEGEKEDSSPANDALVRATLVPFEQHSADQLIEEAVRTSSGLSLEQLEQVNAYLMDIVWKMRGEWNRSKVLIEVGKAFNDIVKDIEDCQNILDPSQEKLRFRNGH